MCVLKCTTHHPAWVQKENNHAPHLPLFSPSLSTISKDGVSLEGDVSLDELWYRAMRGYGNSEWQVTVDNLEEGIRVFTAYEDTALLCLKQCHKKGEPKH